MTTNPITSIIGLLIFLCPIVEHFFPDLKPICDTLSQELIGVGFVAAADGIKRKPE